MNRSSYLPAKTSCQQRSLLHQPNSAARSNTTKADHCAAFHPFTHDPPQPPGNFNRCFRFEFRLEALIIVSGYEKTLTCNLQASVFIDSGEYDVMLSVLEAGLAISGFEFGFIIIQTIGCRS